MRLKIKKRAQPLLSVSFLNLNLNLNLNLFLHLPVSLYGPVQIVDVVIDVT